MYWIQVNWAFSLALMCLLSCFIFRKNNKYIIYETFTFAILFFFIWGAWRIISINYYGQWGLSALNLWIIGVGEHGLPNINLTILGWVFFLTTIFAALGSNKNPKNYLDYLLGRMSLVKKESKRIESQKAYTKKTKKIKAGKIKLTPAELRVHYFEKHKQTLGKKWPEYSKLVADENCFWNFIKIRGPQLKDLHASARKKKNIFENPIDGSEVVENKSDDLYRFDEKWFSSAKALKWLSSKEALQTLQRKYIPFRNYCKKESKQEDVSSYYPVEVWVSSLPDRSDITKYGGGCSKCGTTYGMEFVKEEFAETGSYVKHKNKDGSADRRRKNNSKSYTVYNQQYKCYECSTVTEFRSTMTEEKKRKYRREINIKQWS